MGSRLWSEQVRVRRPLAANAPVHAESLEGRLLMAAVEVNGTTPAAKALEAAVGLIPPPGVLDASFGREGTFFTDFVAADAAAQPDGKLVFSGRRGSRADETARAVCFRLNPDGTRDTTFGPDGDGDVLGEAGTNGVYYATVVDGERIYCAGIENGNLVVVRYTLDGTLDRSFGDGGRAEVDLGSEQDTAYDVALGPGGSVIAVGTAGRRYAAVRFTADGELDPTFGDGGRVVFAPPPPANAPADTPTAEGLADLAIVPDGSGTFYAAGSDGAVVVVAKFRPDGQLDLSFAGSGMVTVERLVAARLEPTTIELSQAIVLQPDGKVVAGNRTSNGQFAVARLNPDGTADPTFGKGGLATADFGAAAPREGGPAGTGGADVDELVLQSSGQILAIGTAPVEGRPAVAVAAFGPDGRLVTSFGEGGRVAIESQPTPLNRELRIGDLVLRAFGTRQADGRLVLGAGDVNPASNSGSPVRRINVPGTRRVGASVPGLPAAAQPQVGLGSFGSAGRGAAARGAAALSVVDRDNSLITLTLRDATAEAFQNDQGQLSLLVTDAGPGATLAVRVSGGDGRAELGDVVVTGTLRSLSARDVDLAGSLLVSGPIRRAVLGNLRGTVASAAGNIGNVSALSLAGARVLSGADFGSDGGLGGTGTAVDVFRTGSIGTLRVANSITSSLIAAGLDPANSAFGDGDDRAATGSDGAPAPGLIRSVRAAGADAATRFVAGTFGRVNLGDEDGDGIDDGPTDPGTDPRFVTI